MQWNIWFCGSTEIDTYKYNVRECEPPMHQYISFLKIFNDLNLYIYSTIPIVSNFQ